MKRSRFQILTAGLIMVSMSVPLCAQELTRAMTVKQLRRMPRGVTEATLKQHQMAPAHTLDVEIEETDPALEINPTRKLPPNVTISTSPQLDVNKFATDLDQYLNIHAGAGYAIQINQNGTPIYFKGAKYAQTPTDLNKSWTGNTRMHVASVSKLLTSMALLRALSKAGISYEHTIGNYLPAYWNKGPKINQIRFKDLLQHHSGFIVGKSATSYQTMKTTIQRGVAGSGADAEYAYQNTNFGLMRIMIPILNGDVDRSAVFSTYENINDQIWDGLTIGFYRDYLQAHVFGPAGVQSAGFLPLPAAADGAVAYKFPALNSHGWNSGDTSTVAGGAGWRLTLSDLMKVVNHFRRKGTIVPNDTAQLILDSKLGIDQNIETPLGRIYNKNGGWHNNGRTEQSVVYFMPNGIEVGVFVNSPLGPQGFSLRNAVKDSYLGAIK